ncbi:MAG TPA: alpha/beta fold hydrolase [Candidatus Acidoferrum sp.]|jgi:pimeloyl-ACP methyl ester carboxylesterase
MSILFELRYPRRWYTKLFMAIVALAFFAVLSIGAVAVFVVYRIVKPPRTSNEINMETFPGRPEAVNFSVGSLGTREGWFFPGFRGAPTIILCHGYGSSRGELLTLVTALQDHQYNVMVFDFAAHGANPGVTTFGYREADEVRAAIDALATRTDIDPQNFGLWGYNLGAYAAMREAESDKRVKAIVVDSIYDSPEEMVKIGVEREGLGRFPLMVRSAQRSFEWMNHVPESLPTLSKSMNSLAGVPKLFIHAIDDPELGEITGQVFAKAPEPKEQAVIAHGNFANMNEEEKRTYENRVVSFFLVKLPASGR